MKLFSATAVVFLSCFPAQHSIAASFDCAKAQGPIEKAICANSELSDLDDLLGRYHQGALPALQENAPCLKSDQQEWLRRTRAACNDAPCLKKVYLERLSELQALQPGINTQRKLELPPGPVLAWAMAPEADRIVAPSIASKLATVQGTLLYDEARNSFVLRAAPGKDYVVLPDIMRNGMNATMLPLLAETSGTDRFSARGRLAVKDEGRPFFDHRHCIYLHRLPR